MTISDVLVGVVVGDALFNTTPQLASTRELQSSIFCMSRSVLLNSLSLPNIFFTNSTAQFRLGWSPSSFKAPDFGFGASHSPSNYYFL